MKKWAWLPAYVPVLTAIEARKRCLFKRYLRLKQVPFRMDMPTEDLRVLYFLAKTLERANLLPLS